MSKEVDLKTILYTIKIWKKESNNPRNDGWVQKGYEDKIKKVFTKAGLLLKRS